MSDDLSENEQWEAIKQWLKENGLSILGGIVVGVGGLLGWRWYQAHHTEQAQTAAMQFQQLQSAVEAGNEADIQQFTGKLREDFSGTPYAEHAELMAARLHVEKGEFDQAAGKLRQVMKDSDDEDLQQVVRLRLARVELAQGQPDAALATLGELKTGAFSSAYNDVRGDALLARGDRTAALDAYQAAFLEAQNAGADTQLLQLKIDELNAGVEVPATPAADTPAAATTPEGAAQ